MSSYAPPPPQAHGPRRSRRPSSTSGRFKGIANHFPDDHVHGHDDREDDLPHEHEREEHEPDDDEHQDRGDETPMNISM